MHQACSEPTMTPVRMVKKTPLSATVPGHPAAKTAYLPGRRGQELVGRSRTASLQVVHERPRAARPTLRRTRGR
jgi:hypothetical protein